MEIEKVCECGCCDLPDHGPCGKFEKGFNGRCVYCDHGKQCHTMTFAQVKARLELLYANNAANTGP